MKRISNVLYYLSACLLIIITYYNYFVGEEYAWIKPLILICTILLFFAYLLNAIDRYSGLFAFIGKKSLATYTLNIPLGKGPRAWRNLTFSASILFGILFGLVFYFLEGGTQLAGAVLFISGFEKLCYYLFSSGKKLFRIGMNEKFLVFHNGNFRIISFNGLKSIEKKYDEILFIYSDGSVKEIFEKMVEAEEEEKFYDSLRTIALLKGASITI